MALLRLVGSRVGKLTTSLLYKRLFSVLGKHNLKELDTGGGGKFDCQNKYQQIFNMGRRVRAH